MNLGRKVDITRLRDNVETDNYLIHIFGWHEIPNIHLYLDSRPNLAMTVDLFLTIEEAELLGAKLIEMAANVRDARA